MPGIFGVITSQPRNRIEPQLQRMQQALLHESSYSTGTWIDESLGVYVGWTSLKDSFSDGMPQWNEKQDVCLIFSGHEYSDAQKINDLRANGHSLGEAESGYLVHLYEEDPHFVENLNGMFHGLVADRRTGITTIFNDRYGMHHLCYHESKDGFYFATEAKAIVAARPELRVSDPQSVGEFVALSCVLENRTIFKNIRVLPAASTWTFRNKATDRRLTYFEPSQWEQQEQLDSEQYYQELRSVLTAKLPQYFAGDRPIGIAMTGGLDTRVILASHRPVPGALPSYTFRGPFRDSRDVTVGKKIAELCRQPHQTITVGNEFLSAFPHYAEKGVYISEGTVDVSRAADLYLSEKAREVAPTKIVGTYGSEIVRHAVMFKPVEPLKGMFSPDFLPEVHRATSTYATFRTEHPVTFAAFRQSPWYHHGILALEQSRFSVRSPFMDNDFVRTVYRAPNGSASNGDVRLRLIRDGNPVLAQIASDRGVGGDGGRLSSALRHGFQEFTFKAEYAYDYGMPQSVARMDHLLSTFHLERMFLGRHKLLHFRLWYRDQLSDYIRQTLLDPKTLSRPFLQKKTVETAVEGHLKGSRNYTTTIHKLLTLELLHRFFFDAQVQN